MDTGTVQGDVLWKQRFRADSISQFYIAKGDPWHGVLTSSSGGEKRIYRWDLHSGELSAISRQPETNYFILSPDGKYLYFMQDEHGSDCGHFVRVPVGGGISQDLTPELPPYTSYAVLASGSGNAVSFTTPGEDGFRAWTLEVKADQSLGQPRLIYQTQSLTSTPCLSWDGKVAFMMSNKRSGTMHFGAVAVDTCSGKIIGELWDGPGINHQGYGYIIPAPFNGDYRVLISTDRSGFPRPLLWDPRTGQRVDLEFPDIPGELAAVDWSADGWQILMRGRYRARNSLYLYDLEQQKMHRIPAKGGTTSNLQFGPAGQIIALWEDACHTSQVVTLDAHDGAVKNLQSADAGLPGRAWQSIEFASSDWVRVQGWLAVPAGQGPFPTVVDAGYIWGVQEDQYHPQSQAWLDHGFAYLYLNRRGSRSFGKEYADKILGNPGRWELEDLRAAHAWLVEQRIAAPGQILLSGWSYGGYLTLLGLGQQPGLWVGGMAGTPPIDWEMVYADGNAAGKGQVMALFGATPEEKPEQFRASSPMTYAEQIQAPVLILAGLQDTLSTTRQVTLFEEKLKALGKSIKVDWYEGGHATPESQVEQAITFQGLMMAFAGRVIGGSGKQG